ncbi:MAG: helix-turn-helix transcriptional regulator [Lewinella sp.]
MQKQLLNYKGLFGDDHGLLADSFLHHEPLQARSFRYNYEIEEHLHSDLFQLFLITSGGGLLLSSGEKIALESPGVLMIPSNELHGFVFQTEVRGEVFTLLEASMDKMLSTMPSVFSDFDQLQYFSLNTGADSFLELLDLKNRIIREAERADPLKNLSLALLFQLFLLTIYRSKRADKEEMVKSDDRILGHFKQFKKLIKQYGHEGKPVKFYAGEMKLTPVHLNRICQMVVQKTALQVVHERVLAEAKKYLKGTSSSIAEIAYFLGFKDPAHFSKFFKKKAGVPPGAFRKSNDSV